MGRKTITLDNGKLDPELQKRIDDAKAEIRAKRKNDVIEAENETKSLADETYGLTAEELELPPRADDPHGMMFTDEEIEALTMTDNEAAKALAFATATPEKLALLRAKE